MRTDLIQARRDRLLQRWPLLNAATAQTCGRDCTTQNQRTNLHCPDLATASIADLSAEVKAPEQATMAVSAPDELLASVIADSLHHMRVETRVGANELSAVCERREGQTQSIEQRRNDVHRIDCDP